MGHLIEDAKLRNSTHVFKDRFHAGELLAGKLTEYREIKDTYVLAIPAGGVQVAYKIAEGLSLPLDVLVTRKLHVPWNKEAGFGAVSWDGSIILNDQLIGTLVLSRGQIEKVVAEEKEIIKKRLNLYRREKPFPSLKGKTVIVVDDGLASGFSMLVTLKSLGKMDVRKIVVAVPTAPITAIRLIDPLSDVIVCLNIRSGPYFAVADAYLDWHDIMDENAMKILWSSWENRIG